MSVKATEAGVLLAFQEFYNALTGVEARQALIEHPELLSDAALAILKRTRDETPDAFTKEAIETACTVLEHYRENWAAFERERGAYVTPPPFVADVRCVQAALAEFESLREASALDQAVGAWERILNSPAFHESPLSFRLAAFNNAGNAYQQRHEAARRPEDLDKALALAELAVNSLPPNSPDRADHINFLTAMLLARYRQTLRLDNLERSIQIGQDLLDHPPPDPRDLADTWSNLGHSLMERHERVLSQNDLEAAIRAYQQAAQEARPEAPHFRIYLNNLGEALRHLYLRTGSREHLENAIQVSEKALSASEGDVVWESKAMTNLANALLDRVELPEQHDDRDLQRAVELLHHASTQTPADSFDRAVIMNSLASVAFFRFRQTGNVSGLEQEIRNMEESVSSVPSHSREVLAFLYNAGNLFSAQYGKTKALGDLEKCIDYWDRACSLLRSMFAAAPVDYKLGQQHKWTGLQRQLVLACLEQADVDPSKATAAMRRAMIITEGWKARLLTELVGRGDLAAPPVISKQVVREKELLAELTALDNVEIESAGRLSASGGLGRLRRREQCREELERLWESMAAKGPAAEDYVKMRRADELNWEQLSALASELGAETVLISHLITGNRTLLFILRSGWSAPKVVGVDVDEDAGLTMLRRLFREIYTDPQGSPAARETWDETIRPLLEKAAPHLIGATRAVFVPGGSGYLIPWAVLAERAGWRLAGGSPMPLVNIPALAVLRRLLRRPTSKGHRPLVVGDPRNNMFYGEDEAREIAALLHARPLLGDKANKAAVRSRLLKASIAHLATHAYFVPGSPLDSGIRLADEDLTARDLMNCSLKADLIVLSACETGRAEALAGDEVAGLAMALLQAGARTVLVSLWPVSGLATATLMSSFYAAWERCGDKASALSEAVSAVRSGGWTHPHYWSAFVLFGDSSGVLFR